MFGSSVVLLEGASMGALMIYHLINFNGGSLFTSREDEEELAYISIMLGEYYRFDTESVENVDLNDESPDRTMDSVE